jgi:hypothetical protein
LFAPYYPLFGAPPVLVIVVSTDSLHTFKVRTNNRREEMKMKNLVANVLALCLLIAVSSVAKAADFSEWTFSLR